MKPYRLIAYSLMTAGTIISSRAHLRRIQAEESNIHAAIMLDWGDVQAVATRANLPPEANSVAGLLALYKENGATHLSLPELTLQRLLEKGELWPVSGPDPQRIYLQARQPDLFNRITVELSTRLPHLQVKQSDSPAPAVSFLGDLPSVAEVGLGFDPAHAALARQAGLFLVPRPIGYSWVQPEMIERTLAQAAELGARMIAVQGRLIPGHEFELHHTVAAMRQHGLTLAYFSESRHQKGDWFLAKSLAAAGQVVLAHEFEPEELLEEDWHTAAYRWANLAVEAGIRLCSLRFFRILHAADPLESLAYVHAVAHALEDAGLLPGHAGQVDLSPFLPKRDRAALAAVGLSIAGAAGLAADWLPLPDSVKLVGMSASALALTTLPLLEQRAGQPPAAHHHPHEHAHFYGHHHHNHAPNEAFVPDDDDTYVPDEFEGFLEEYEPEPPPPNLPHDHEHHHDDHHHDTGHASPATAYAPKALALAASLVYPAAAIALNDAGPLTAIAQAALVSAAGSAALSAITTETDSLLGLETNRNYNLDWLIPLTLAASTSLWPNPHARQTGSPISNPQSPWRWLPLATVGFIAFKNLGQSPDALAALDREHRHAHTHHLSAFQRGVGDVKMLLSLRPLRKWAFLAPLGAALAAIFQQQRRDDLAATALTTAAAGQVATLAGFRNGPRPVLKTVKGRAKTWAIGAVLAGTIGLVYALLNLKRR